MKKVFMSCTLEGMTSMEQHKAMKSMEYDLRNYKFQQVEGYCKGVKEVSFMISQVVSTTTLERIAEVYRQKTIMLVASYGGCTIKTIKDGSTQGIGTLTKSTDKPNTDYYSYDPFENVFYSVVV
jgi:hypothetical protein